MAYNLTVFPFKINCVATFDGKTADVAGLPGRLCRESREQFYFYSAVGLRVEEAEFV